MKKVRWYQKLLCSIASKIINKYDIHTLTLRSKINLNGSLYIVSSYSQRESIDEHPSMNIEGVGMISQLSLRRKSK